MKYTKIDQNRIIISQKTCNLGALHRTDRHQTDGRTEIHTFFIWYSRVGREHNSPSGNNILNTFSGRLSKITTRRQPLSTMYWKIPRYSASQSFTIVKTKLEIVLLKIILTVNRTGGIIQGYGLIVRSSSRLKRKDLEKYCFANKCKSAKWFWWSRLYFLWDWFSVWKSLFNLYVCLQILDYSHTMSSSKFVRTEKRLKVPIRYNSVFS